jgi:hypothetical protein
MDVVAEAAARPTRVGYGGRYYIGPKAQTTVDERFHARAFVEAEKAGTPMTAVWREVLYAGLLATGRASRAEIAEACEVLGMEFPTFSLPVGEA